MTPILPGLSLAQNLARQKAKALWQCKYVAPVFMQIISLAGSGKTLLAWQNGLDALEDHKSVAYRCFNKEIQRVAKDRFGKNVDCQTLSASALSYLNKHGYLKRDSSNRIAVTEYSELPASFIQQAVGTQISVLRGKGLHCARIVERLRQSYKLWQVSPTGTSAADNVSPVDDLDSQWQRCCPTEQFATLLNTVLCQVRSGLYSASLGSLNKLAREHAITHPEDPAYMMAEADVVIIDECQDMNAIDIESLPIRPGQLIILIGDPNQCIYRFRGANNGWLKLHYHERAELPETYRCGSAVVDLANCVLSKTYKIEDSSGPLMRAALDHTGAVLTVSEALSSNVRPDIIVHRTNLGAIATAVEMANDYEVRLDTRLDLSWLEAGWMMFRGMEINHTYWKKYKTWDVYERTQSILRQDYPRFRRDISLKSLFEKVDFASRFANLQRSQYADAPIMISTIHKTKGLEYDTIQLGSDLSPFSDIHADAVEQMNVIYVGITRAKNTLIVPDDLLEKIQQM